MKNMFTVVAFITALTCGTLLAQSTSPSAANQPAPAASHTQNEHANRVAPGSVIPVQLTKTVDAKKAKTGDEVVAKVTQDMKTQSGEVLVPKDTKVFGHITEAQARNKEQKESELAIAFDHAVTKEGNTMQMPMSIQAVIGQQRPQQDQNANAPAGGGQSAGAPSGAASTGGTPRSSGIGGGSAPPPPSASGSENGGGGSESQTGNGGLPPINGQTQGVIGISNVTLAPATNETQGPVLTSEKNNVKLESGTLLLLKVKQ